MSKQKLWRCWNEACTEHPAGRPGYDFAAEHPVCPKCGADARRRDDRHCVVGLEPVHFEPPGKRRGKGAGHLACEPGKPRSKPHSAGDPRAVTCPDCRQSAAWREAMELCGEGVPEKDDFRLGVEDGVVQKQQ